MNRKDTTGPRLQQFDPDKHDKETVSHLVYSSDKDPHSLLSGEPPQGRKVICRLTGMRQTSTQP